MIQTGKLRSDYKLVLECLIEWNDIDIVVELIQAHLDVENPVKFSESSKKGSKRARKNANNEEEDENLGYKRAIIAVAFIDGLLQNEKTRKKILYKDRFTTIATQLKSIVQGISSFFTAAERPCGMLYPCSFLILH